MAVRLRLRIKVGGKEIEETALLNSGYESQEPELAVPTPVAEKLGLWPLPEGTRAEYVEYETAGGPAFMIRLRSSGEVRAISEDRVGPPAQCRFLIASQLDEVLVSDRAIDALGLAVESFGEGLWRFRDEPPERVRRSRN